MALLAHQVKLGTDYNQLWLPIFSGKIVVPVELFRDSARESVITRTDASNHTLRRENGRRYETTGLRERNCSLTLWRIM